MASKRSYDEYLEVKKITESIAEKKRLRKQVIMSSAVAVYLAIVGLLFTQTSVLSKFFSFIKNDNGTSKDIQDIKKRLSNLEQDNNKLEEIINKQNPQNLSYYGFNNRLDELEKEQKNLSDAVLLNPQEVVTARLITEKQKILEEQFNSLENSFQRVSDNLNKLFWAAIILPLIALIWNLIKDKILKKNTEIDIF